MVVGLAIVSCWVLVGFLSCRWFLWFPRVGFAFVGVLE